MNQIVSLSYFQTFLQIKQLGKTQQNTIKKMQAFFVVLPSVFD